MFAGKGPPRHSVFVRSSEGDVRRMETCLVAVGCRHGLEVGKPLEFSTEFCGWIAEHVLHVVIMQAEVGKEGDSCSVLVGGAWTVSWACCWVFLTLCSTEALTRTQSGRRRCCLQVQREGGSQRVPWLVGWLDLLRMFGTWVQE